MRIFMSQELVWHAEIQRVPSKYQSGEEIHAGDRIRYAGEAGTVEFVTGAASPEHNWYIEQFGGGCMLKVAPFGSLFLNDPQKDDDLEFVSRAQP
jgi:hypothetical protein